MTVEVPDYFVKRAVLSYNDNKYLVVALLPRTLDLKIVEDEPAPPKKAAGRPKKKEEANEEGSS